MDRTRFIEHRGKRILLMDYTGIRAPAEALEAIEASKGVVRLQPPKSLRVITDVTGSHYDSTVVAALKELASHNTPFVTASAVVGVTGLMRVVLSGIIMFSKRKIQTFDTREAAMEWLVQQE
ncbi:MAG TPA: hypothetical protein VFE05_16660 [Longimicrobiaceae bacterium]|jgi:hypothetical protein|nr:hypothetical protein [Longimicrobiaceae bacterium]